MKKVRVGDVFEMPFWSKYSYLQFIAAYLPIGHTIRVYTSLHDEPLTDLREMVRGRSFRCMTIIGSFLSPPPLIRLVGNLPLHSQDASPVYYRFTKPNSAGISQVLGPDGLGVVDRALSNDEMAWPRFPGYSTPPSIKQLILKDNGINVPIEELIVDQGDGLKAEEGEGSFYLYFKRKRDAVAASESMRLPGFRSKVIHDDISVWLLLVVGKPTENISDIEDNLRAIARACHGRYDGFELPVV